MLQAQEAKKRLCWLAGQPAWGLTEDLWVGMEQV